MPADILEVLRSGEFDYTKAVAIAKVKDEEIRQNLIKEARDNDLSLSEIRQKISQINQKSKPQEDFLKSGLDSAYRLVKKSQVGNDSKKRKQLENLLNKIKNLLVKIELFGVAEM